jgi:hypothetical protein
MYAMIKGCKMTLELIDGIPLSVDKANAVKAWAYWWKGYAYAEVGTLYYAGLIVEQANSVSNTVESKFVKRAIIAESKFDLAMNTLKAISNQSDYDAIIKALIPTKQAGLGKSYLPVADPNHQHNVGAEHFIKSLVSICKWQSGCYN